MKKIFTRLAAYIVTWYADRLYRKAVALAEKKNLSDPKRQYIISHPVKMQRLMVLDAKEFQAMRRKYLIPNGTVSRNCLEKESWYYTSGLSGRDAMKAREKEVRRLAFIRMMLGKANLL